MELLELMRHRRSVRRYTEAEVSTDTLEAVLQAGLLAPSSRNVRPWAFIAVHQRETLDYLAECRDGGHAKMLAGAAAAIVVVGEPDASDVWVEDCAIAMAHMHLAAAALGLGSCWIQGRLRTIGDETTDAYVRKRLHYPSDYQLEAILSLGVPAAALKAHSPDTLPVGKVHWEGFE